MGPGIGILGEPVFADGPPPTVGTPYSEFVRSGRDGVFLADIDVRNKGSAADIEAPIQILADPVLADLPPGGIALGAVETLRFSDHTWISKPDDPRITNVSYRPRLLSALNVTRTASLRGGRRQVQTTTGYVELANRDGKLDYLAASRSADGLPTLIRHGPRRSYLDSFRTRLSVRGFSFEGTRDRVRLELQGDVSIVDGSLALDYYDGRGGLGGDPELAGLPVPDVFGPAFNVTPRLILKAFRVWQAGLGPLLGITEIRDRALPYTIVADVPDLNALVSYSLGTGEAVTCNALGLFRLWADPVGRVTFDANGYVWNGVYINTLPLMAEYILRVRARLPAGEFDRSGTYQMPNYEANYATGTSTPSCADVLDLIAESASAFYGRRRSGLYGFTTYAAPENYSAPAPILVKSEDIRKEHNENSPISEQTVWYKTNWTVMSDDEVSEVAPNRDQYLSAGQYITIGNGLAAAFFPSARPAVPIYSLLTQQSLAEQRGRAAVEMDGVERDIFTVDAGRFAADYDLGDIVSFTANRYGAGGPPFIIEEISERDNEQGLLRVIGSANRI